MRNTIPVENNELDESDENVPVENEGPENVYFIEILRLVAH